MLISRPRPEPTILAGEDQENTEKVASDATAGAAAIPVVAEKQSAIAIVKEEIIVELNSLSNLLDSGMPMSEPRVKDAIKMQLSAVILKIQSLKVFRLLK